MTVRVCEEAESVEHGSLFREEAQVCSSSDEACQIFAVDHCSLIYAANTIDKNRYLQVSLDAW